MFTRDRLTLVTSALMYALALVLITTTSSLAFCGLQSCPRPSGSGETPLFEAALRTRMVAYDIADNEGHYLVMAPRLFVRRSGFALGAEVPLTRLENTGVVSSGFSNPVIMALYARRLSYTWSAEVGMQWELPIGNQADGLAGDHHMLLPWIGVRHDIGTSWYLSGMVGYSSAIGGNGTSSGTSGSSAQTLAASLADPLAKSAHAGHDHDAAPVLVNPHADREAQARLAMGWVHGRGTVEGFALGQTDVTSAGPETYVRTGASYEWSLARFTAVQVIADIPVTPNRRNEVEIGLTLKTGI